MARGPLAGAAGPGKFAKRTDLPSQYYGEGLETANLQSQSKMSKTRGIADNVGGRPAGAPTVSAPVTELFAPTERPEEPITTGLDRGLGAGSDSLMMNQIQQDDKDIVAKYLPSLSAMASQQDTPKSFRAFVSFLQGSL
jgi:hypothetical protein